MISKYLLYAGLLATIALSGCSAAGRSSKNSTGAAPAQAATTAAQAPKTSESDPKSAPTDAAPSSSSTPGDNTYHKISAEEAKEMIDNGGVIVVDVRRPDEYGDRHIPGAINVPNEDISDQQPEALPDLDAILLIHCRTGVRSKAASDKLLKMGYTNVYDFGGIVDWPYETETGSAQ